MNTFSELLAQDVMSSPVYSTSPESGVDELEQDFVRHGVSAMPVVEQGKIVGVISRSDLMQLPVLSSVIESSIVVVESNMVATGISAPVSQTFQVSDLMTRDVVQCSPETELSQVAADMVKEHVHHIVVVKDNKPVGVISSLDIVKLTAK